MRKLLTACATLHLLLYFLPGYMFKKTTDVTFVIDTTADITHEAFDDVIDFVSNITNKLTIGINNTMVAVVTFNDNQTTQFDLDDYSDRTSLLSAINDLKKIPLSGVRNTHLALDHVHTNIYIPGGGARIDANSVVILITYRESASPVQTLFSAFFLQGAVTIYSIGVGNFVLDSTKTEDLRNIATNPDNEHVFYIESTLYLCSWVYNLSLKLDATIINLQEDICPEMLSSSTVVITTKQIWVETTTMHLFVYTFQATSTDRPTTSLVHSTSTERSTTASSSQVTSTTQSRAETSQVTTTYQSTTTSSSPIISTDRTTHLLTDRFTTFKSGQSAATQTLADVCIVMVGLISIKMHY